MVSPLTRLAYLNTFLSVCQPYFSIFCVFYTFSYFYKKPLAFLVKILYNESVKQSRCSRVQCQWDGELPIGRRKIFFAV